MAEKDYHLPKDKLNGHQMDKICEHGINVGCICLICDSELIKKWAENSPLRNGK